MSRPTAVNNDVTRLCKIEYPIFMGAMGQISLPSLAAAVSNAGGCGILSAMTYSTGNELRSAIQETRSLIKDNRPFGVNIPFLSNAKLFSGFGTKNKNNLDYNAQVRNIVIEEGIPIVEVTASNDADSVRDSVSFFKGKNVVVIYKCHSVRNALIAAECGADILSLDAFESGGHFGFDEISNVVLLPLVRKVLPKIPIIASGGIVNGKQMASMLCLGAQGVKLGTRFIATMESPVDVNCKLTIVKSQDQDATQVVYKNAKKSTMRVYNNGAAREVLDKERAGAGTAFENFSVKEAMLGGKVDDFVWSIGQGVCLVDDVPSCKQVIEDMMRQCRDTLVIKSKL